jgi:3-oxoacyl-[acyl-carrier protein] reductase
VGEATALLLAQRGCDIIVNYHSKRLRAEVVVHEIRALGRRALLAQADLTSSVEVETMLESAGREFGRVDVLILNASGGLEKGKPAEYAMQLNLTAQVRLADLSLKWMPRGGRIVFVTSHMAHFYGERGMVGPYEPVAASKYAGEQALRGRRAELAKHGILSCHRQRRYDRGYDHSEVIGTHGPGHDCGPTRSGRTPSHRSRILAGNSRRCD